MPILFNFHILLSTFYTIFGTNILIQCPVPVPVCCKFYVSQNIHIKQNPDGIKTDGAYFWNIWKILEEKSTRDGARGGHEAGERACPPGRAPASWAPWDSTDLNSNSIYSRSGRKKIREKDSSRFTIRSRRQALISLGRADLESVRGSGEGNSSPSSSLTFLHHQFHDAHRRA